MGILIKNNIVNQKGNPAWYESSLATRPIANLRGRMFVDTDTPSTGIYRDNGTTWDQVADPGAGSSGTLQQVTTNGSSTNVGISVSANGIGIGTTIPGANILDIHGTTGVLAQLENTGAQNSLLSFRNQGAGVWSIGNGYNAGANDFIIYDAVNFTNRLNITNAGVISLTGNLNVSSTIKNKNSLEIVANSDTGATTTLFLGTNSIGLYGSAIKSNSNYSVNNGTDLIFQVSSAGVALTAVNISTNGTFTLGSTTGVGLYNFYASGAYIGNFTPIGDTTLPIQINAGVGGQAYFASNNNSGYGLLIGYDNANGYARIRNISNTNLTLETNNVSRVIVKSNGIFNLINVPIYATNALALAGGLITGDIYKNSVGVLSIVL